MFKPGSKVKIVTLGCAKNEVDSEEIAGVLASAGYDVDGSGERSDVTVINTCGFLAAAKEESVRAIRQAVADKEQGKTGKVIVAGCLAQRLGSELARLAPGADAYVGVGQMGRFDEIVRGISHPQPPPSRTNHPSGTGMEISHPHPSQTQGVTPPSKTNHFEGWGLALIDNAPPHHRWAAVETRARAGRPWSAYLKVSEGCDHKCTFCTIPSFRGAHQSKPIERVLAEARHLASTGCKEINLIAQDVTQYGYDLYREFTLPRLLRELNAIDGLEWIRILYFYPNRLTDEVIKEAGAIGPKVKLVMLNEPLPVDHCPCCKRGLSRTLTPAVVTRLTDPRWAKESLCSIYINPDQPSLAIHFSLGELQILSGTLHLCQGKLLHYSSENIDERIPVRQRPSIRTQAAKIVHHILSEWSPARVLIGTGNPDRPEIISELELPSCWEARTT